MSGELRELYQELIFDHCKRPRNRRALEGASHRAEGHNPLCGDHVTVSLRVEDGTIREAAFEGDGCAIATASASLMTEALAGRRLEEVEPLFEDFHRLVTGGGDPPRADLGKLAALAGVREFPARVKCATLAWHTLNAALEHGAAAITTEKPMKEVQRDEIVAALRTVYDPEIPVNIYDLGLIYDIALAPEGRVDIRMTLTAPSCPVAGEMPGVVESRVAQVAGVNDVRVDLVWDPPWGQERLSDAAKLQLGLL